MPSRFVPRGSSTVALAYVTVDENSASEDDQRRAIVAWAARAGVSIAVWHVTPGPTSDAQALMAVIEALPSANAGWLVVASLDRLHPESEYFAPLFDTLTHANGARLVSADGSFDPEPGQECPVCRYSVHPSSRYPRALCGLCIREATDEHGRLLHFFNVDATGGFRAEYADTGEAREGHICYVHGVRCWADEAYFGGIVIEPRS
jgi:hypothetical protein